MAYEKFSLDKKIAVITGAAGLLGVQHAYALLESGAKVVLTDINENELESAYLNLTKHFNDKYISIIKMDVSSEISVSQAAKKIFSKHGCIDILINNAAIDPKVMKNSSEFELTRFENFSLDQWSRELSVGLTGAFICSKVFGSAMAQNKKGGVILNISSDLSVISPDHRLYEDRNLSEDKQKVKPVTYSVIKTGLIGLTRYIATYWIDKNIRCNALSPGGVFNGQHNDFVRKISSLIPLGRMADVDEYRSAIQFLCSDASSYMNGQNIVIDGGRSIW